MGLISLQMTQMDIKLRQLVFTERTQEEAHSSAHAQQQGLGGGQDWGHWRDFRDSNVIWNLMLSFSRLFLIFFSVH